MEIVTRKSDREFFNQLITLKSRGENPLQKFVGDPPDDDIEYRLYIKCMRLLDNKIIKRSREHYIIYIIIRFLMVDNRERLRLLSNWYYFELFAMDDVNIVYDLFRAIKPFNQHDREDRICSKLESIGKHVVDDKVILYRSGYVDDGISYAISYNVALYFFDESCSVDNEAGTVGIKAGHTQLMKCAVPIENIFFVKTIPQTYHLVGDPSKVYEVVVGFPDGVEVLSVTSYDDIMKRRDKENRRKKQQKKLEDFMSLINR